MPSNKVKNIAVILAAGSGARFGESTPKQFVKLAGRMIIEHTLGVFQASDGIDEIAVVVQKDYQDLISTVRSKNKFDKITKILIGGKERYESSLVAINAFSKPEYTDANVLIHDAVRPFVTNEIIKEIIYNLNNSYKAIDVAVPATDTIITVQDGTIAEIPERKQLQYGQTPQGFKIETIKQAYELALNDPNFSTTDDCGVVQKYLPHEPIKVVMGDYRNFKITNRIDLDFADKIFQTRIKTVSQKLNDNLLTDFFRKKTVIIFGGSSGIGKSLYESINKYTKNVFQFSRRNGVNVCSYSEIRQALTTIYDKTGSIDIVINTAGVLKIGKLYDMDYDSIHETINTNLLGSFNVAKESLNFLKKSKGTLILFASSSYSLGRADYSAYSASKAGIVNMTQALADEWGEFNIKINCMTPQRTKTPLRFTNFGEEPAHTLLTSDQVARETISLIMSGETGQIIGVSNTNIIYE